ncbi:MAG: hypothetical protein Q8T08_02585 [Ignavibacteria bacterium]|nr:hypothetical protein [Ignavibacteria bacterium]
MQGKILDYNNEFKSGLIRGEDGNKYRFSIDDCKSDLKPRPNAEVDFEANGDKAVEIYVMTKDTVSAAVDASVLAAKASTSVIKKIMPYAILIAVVIVLVSLIAVASDKYDSYQYEEARKHEEAKIKQDSEKAKLLFQDKQYNEALALYTDLFSRRNDVNFNLMAAECLIKLNNPIRAEAVLRKVDVSDTLINDDGEQYDNNIDEREKARYYILKANINKLNNKYKSYGILDSDYYSANAEEACKYGDCSLVKK